MGRGGGVGVVSTVVIPLPSLSCRCPSTVRAWVALLSNSIWCGGRFVRRALPHLCEAGQGDPFRFDMRSVQFGTSDL